MQLVFGRDAMLNIPFAVSWKSIKQRKQDLIDKYSVKENAKRVPHIYRVGDLVLVNEEQSSKFGKTTFKGGIKVTQVRDRIAQQQFNLIWKKDHKT